MKFQAIVLASFLVMPYALADDQGGLKQDAAPPPPHAICKHRSLPRHSVWTNAPTSSFSW